MDSLSRLLADPEGRTSTGDGSGSGSGDGYGYGDGSGDGSGYGYGDGSGDGSGYGYGYGYGDGSGDGSGYGYGYGYGYGGFRRAVLRLQLEQSSDLFAYKLVTDTGLSPMSSVKLKYAIGVEVSATADANDDNDCSVGVNVADLGWVLSEWKETWRILRVRFRAEDIASIPFKTGGKFRLHRCTPVEDCDLVKLGLIAA